MTHIALITGASKGIGKATAQTFLNHDWHVINLSRSHCDLTDVANIALDFSQAGWEKKYAETIQQHLKNADKICLVHNAGVLYKDNVVDADVTHFRRALEINVVTPLLLNQCCLPYMPAGSSIIYVGSTLSEKAVANTLSYVTSKHAMAGLMRATTQDLAGRHIHACCVCPGFTDTEMLRSHIGNDADMMTAIKQRVGDDRLIQPTEIADFIYFCAQNPVVNGAMLPAHLGQIEL